MMTPLSNIVTYYLWQDLFNVRIFSAFIEYPIVTNSPIEIFNFEIIACILLW